ncbi:hypothetical protein AMECASPLE_019258 [Ameca splendens]|uniref:Uncharacterized protein n=1 Tax=Ameca splendens TaxID=208324 RepID=A0ABV0Z110_9TELE
MFCLFSLPRSYNWPDSVSTCDTFLEGGIVQASAGNKLPAANQSRGSRRHHSINSLNLFVHAGLGVGVCPTPGGKRANRYPDPGAERASCSPW